MSLFALSVVPGGTEWSTVGHGGRSLDVNCFSELLVSRAGFEEEPGVKMLESFRNGQKSCDCFGREEGDCIIDTSGKSIFSCREGSRTNTSLTALTNVESNSFLPNKKATSRH